MTEMGLNSNMKFHHVFVYPLILLDCFMVQKVYCSQHEVADTFNAVTGFSEVGQLYTKLRTKEPHLQPNTTVNAEMKKRICHSVATSAYFDLDGWDSVDMDDIYDELKSNVEKQKQESDPDIWYEKVMEDYEQNESGRMIYTYRSRPTPFRIRTVKEEEFAFACWLRYRKTQQLEVVIYISDPYNLNSLLDTHTEERINARFVCLGVRNFCDILAIAEQPPIVLTKPEYPLEDMYAQLKDTYATAQKASDDPLCGLTKSEKLRACTVALSSSYFSGKTKFYPVASRLKEECELKKVSFQSEVLDAAVFAEDRHKEWMLSCTGEQMGPGIPVLTYYVSRAYCSQQVFIYFRDNETGKWYIENISGNIGVLFEKHSKGCAQLSIYKLANQLQHLKLQSDEKPSASINSEVN